MHNFNNYRVNHGKQRHGIETVYQTHNSPTDHRGSMTSMIRGHTAKIRSVGSFFASLDDARAPFCNEISRNGKTAKCEANMRGTVVLQRHLRVNHTLIVGMEMQQPFSKKITFQACPCSSDGRGGPDRRIHNMLGPATRPTPLAVTPPTAWNTCSHSCRLCSICTRTTTSTYCRKKSKKQIVDTAASDAKEKNNRHTKDDVTPVVRSTSTTSC